MNTASRITATIAAINSLLPATAHLSPDIEGMTDEASLSEYFFIRDVRGAVVASGYSEADLLANLRKLETEGVQQ